MRIDKAISTTKKKTAKQTSYPHLEKSNLQIIETTSSLTKARLSEAENKSQFEQWERDLERTKHLELDQKIAAMKGQIAKNHEPEKEEDDHNGIYWLFSLISILIIICLGSEAFKGLFSSFISITKAIFPLLIIMFVAWLFHEEPKNESDKKTTTQHSLPDPKPVIITPKRVKLELSNTNTLLAQSPMTASTDEQLIFADKANNQLVVNDVVIAAFDKEKAIDLTIANEQLKMFLSTLESSILSTMK